MKSTSLIFIHTLHCLLIGALITMRPSMNLKEFKDCEKPQDKHHKKRHALFHSQWKGITYLLFNNSRRIS